MQRYCMFFTILNCEFSVKKKLCIFLVSWLTIFCHACQEESVKINSRHARKCYANFMASMFKIIGRFLEHQLTKSAAFDIPLLRR